MQNKFKSSFILNREQRCMFPFVFLSVYFNDRTHPFLGLVANHFIFKLMEFCFRFFSN